MIYNYKRVNEYSICKQKMLKNGKIYCIRGTRSIVKTDIQAMSMYSKTSSDGLWKNLPTKSDVAQVPEASDKNPEGTRGENHPFHDDWNFFSVQCKINNNQFITLIVVDNYNKNMRGLDKCDQMTKYYSTPRQ